MNKNRLYHYTGFALFLLSLAACKPLEIKQRAENRTVPGKYSDADSDTVNTGKIKWNSYFSDPNLQGLIGQALANNQELHIMLQEIEIAKNEVSAKKGEYLPSVGVKVGAGVDKVSRYTNIGAMEKNTEIEPGREMPEPLFDFGVGVQAQWETDIWGKLHNATKAQLQRYFASLEGKNFMVTHLIAEIADSYYELLALDNELMVINENVKIQNDALVVVNDLKKNARSNKLAVKRFEAQILKTQGMQYDIKQKITETENRINYLVGRFPQPVQRDQQSFDKLVPQTVYAGIPADLLENRPDIKQAEYELAASKLDIKSAKARFYPSLDIAAGVGFQAFDPTYLIKPEAFLSSLVGELTAPLINKRAIKAAYYNANARQAQAVYHYEQTILAAYIEVANQLSKIKNLENGLQIKTKEVDALNESIGISNDLFKYARADYMEVLLTQRDALESKFELVEKKVNQLKASVAIYRSLGGGWDHQ
ncbi:RND transporter [Sphingobacterium siyangense]|uniref:Efflux transporter outer membrane subunit n=2 Tax=Sphingobacterium TaxID=28453 RepID=A0ABX7CSZ3_SPHMU|nr:MULTISPECIES: efflux transporter outer membrane subunit [Sphingobacterium]QQT29567.1 efflux transporter outer membrane subunit [Sphingobacterium multivorum]QQT54413.1 efflux transporter outer membrane subunit [Sphingobacterium multivorum]RKF30922.1 RND transporter [Sphingobacterium siyangense]